MKDYKDVIERMDGLVNQYFTMKELDGNKLNDILVGMCGCLYYLEHVRSDFHDKFQSTIKRLVDEGLSVSRSENQAHVDYPEMYQLRRIMSAGYEIVGAIRTNISLLKHEQKLEQ